MKTGVYQIRNRINQKRYIGSAAGRGFVNRWNLHVRQLEAGQHTNKILQRAWRKYHREAFVFEILEECEPRFCIGREQYWIDTLQPEYNIAPVAGSQLGYRHSSVAKDKIRRSRLGRATPNHRGELHSMSCLKEQDVWQIRKLLTAGVLQKEIAVKFGVDQSTVSNIKTGKQWGWLK